jgi:hypothetical protein
VLADLVPFAFVAAAAAFSYGLAWALDALVERRRPGRSDRP